jgi:hypothetical protein
LRFGLAQDDALWDLERGGVTTLFDCFVLACAVPSFHHLKTRTFEWTSCVRWEPAVKEPTLRHAAVRQIVQDIVGLLPWDVRIEIGQNLITSANRGSLCLEVEPME